MGSDPVGARGMRSRVAAKTTRTTSQQILVSPHCLHQLHRLGCITHDPKLGPLPDSLAVTRRRIAPLTAKAEADGSRKGGGGEEAGAEVEENGVCVWSVSSV